ncbi:hypothetical protein [Streptomyces sp. NPDC050535]|uniref:hypothetical protein n=1 Tax=Streptomyces sp. NPDC050535 TaxID=3365626 RepID=UPI0037A5BF4C
MFSRRIRPDRQGDTAQDHNARDDIAQDHSTPDDSARTASPFDVLIGHDGTATVDGEPLHVPPGEPVHVVVLDMLHGHAQAWGVPVEGVIFDRQGGEVTLVEVAPDGSSRVLLHEKHDEASPEAEPRQEAPPPTAAQPPAVAPPPVPVRSAPPAVAPPPVRSAPPAAAAPPPAPTPPPEAVAPQPVMAAPSTAVAPQPVLDPPPVAVAPQPAMAAPSTAAAPRVPAPPQPAASGRPVGPPPVETGYPPAPEPPRSDGRPDGTHHAAVDGPVPEADPDALPEPVPYAIPEAVPDELAELVALVRRSVDAGALEQAAALAFRLREHTARAFGPEHPYTLEAHGLEAFVAHRSENHRLATATCVELARIRHRQGDPRVHEELTRAAAAWLLVDDVPTAVDLGRALLAVLQAMSTAGGEQGGRTVVDAALPRLVNRRMHALTSASDTRVTGAA